MRHGGLRRGEAEPLCLSLAAAGLHPLLLFPPADDNSNQSSIADASPIKQENSSNSSPAPEPSSAGPGDGPDNKADEAQADGRELPGAEGTRRGLGSVPGLEGPSPASLQAVCCQVFREVCHVPRL